MEDVGARVGARIRHFRKKRGMTLAELASRVYKSQSAISKYEHGEVAIDVTTLYAIADALQVGIDLLLYIPERPRPQRTEQGLPSFFDGCSHFYSYVFDGRVNKIIRCAFDVLDETSAMEYGVAMYMNFTDYDAYQDCETSYKGTMSHQDALTNILLVNRESPIEQASVQILASYLDTDTKWGLCNGLSSRPMMPIATKMLFSKRRLDEGADLIRELKISRDDIRMLKLYNMFCVM